MNPTTLQRLLALCLILVGFQHVYAQNRVMVSNQGNFSDGNGSVTLRHDLTLTQNFVSDIGSIIQSVQIVGDKLYVLSNTAERIDIFDINTGDQIGQIPNVVSPRYMVVLDNTRAFVTNLYKELFAGGMVTVLDLEADSVITTIDVGNNPEGLVISNNQLFVANNSFGLGTTVSVIDIDSYSIIDTIDVGCDGPRMLFADAQDELMVFCTGKTEYNADFTEIIAETNGQIVFWDGAAGKLTDRIILPEKLGATGPGQDADYAHSVQEAYAVMGNRILRIDTETNTLTDTLDVPAEDLIGAVAYEPTTEQLYVGRIPISNSFTTNGSVSVLDRLGTEVDRFEAGIAPTFIAIDNQIGTATEPVAGALPKGFVLRPNYPNPFNPSTNFEFLIPFGEQVSLKIYSLLGHEIATVVDDFMTPGTYRASWQAHDLASGSYIYQLKAGPYTQTRTLTLLK